MDAKEICEALNSQRMTISTYVGRDVFASQNDFQRLAREAEDRTALNAIAYNQKFPQDR